MPATRQTRAYVALLLVVLLWGSYPALIKLALRDFPPLFLGALRSVVASTFLVWMLARAGADTARGLGPRALGAFLVLGISGIAVSTQLSYLALYFTTAGNVAILQCATPVLVALGARFYLGERLGGLQWLGVAASGFGVLLVVTSGRLANLRIDELRAGDFINILGLTGWAAYTVYGRRVLATHSPALTTTAAYVLGTLIVIPTAVVATPFFPAPRLASPIGWFVVISQGVLGAVAHVWWYRAVLVVGPSRAAIFMNLQPVVGLVLAVWLLAEHVGLWHLAGAACVLAGVALTSRAQVARE
ncbi:MAG: DMT family transporter [Candidatus Rokubacteria bacterium]|nr:DMT family transporter [Candidatus Rokubacteria bacterium]MBI3825376.1 DMT family transporter [Candidatus Rokubacteria bacterium]